MSRRIGAGRLPVEPNSITCPCLVSGLDDRLCMYPASVYCRPPAGGIRVPALDTLMRLCTGEYSQCARYQSGNTMGGVARG
jgi:hypothetical protein